MKTKSLNLKANQMKFVSLLVIPFVVVSITNIRLLSAQTLIDTGAASNIGASIDNGPGMNPGSIRAKINADLQAQNKNIRNNQDQRNTLVQQRMMGSSTPDGKPIPTRMIPPPKMDGRDGQGSSTPNRPKMGGPGFQNQGSTTRPFGEMNRPGNDRLFGSTTPIIGADGRPIPRGERGGYGNASSSPIVNGRGDNGQPNLLDQFRERKDNVAKQFEVAVNNLTNLRQRIGSRIEKEVTAGKDMSKAKILLAIADTKLANLKTAADALKAFTPATSTNPRGPKVSNGNQASSSPTLNIDAGRTLVEAVQKAIHASQKALSDVVVEIAHVMGVNLNDNGQQNATSTPLHGQLPPPPRNASSTDNRIPPPAPPTPSASPTSTPAPTNTLIGQ